MPLSTGTKLGTYEVTSHIGSGGMGEVYQAHDSKLGRDVAIKVLPEQFARDPERLARFQREAKMLAALNHPNIAAIYGLEESGSTHYLVMELVPGDTLRERVAGGRPVPIEEALTIAKQIAEALEAAHNSEKGIIHRDLKPANVKVTPEGRVKVLDFGLAKAFTNDASSENIGNSPTLSMAATVQGVIMGTAAYMSPEQARGKHVNKATDIFAFGAVLYELLTGKQAFHGDDVSDILAAVIRAEPDWSKLPADTPQSIRTLLRRCLKKDRHQRLQDATGIRIEIEDVLSGAASETVGPAPIGRLAFPGQMAWMVAAGALAIVAVATSWALWRATRPVERALVRLDVDLGSDVSLGSIAGADEIISPDGTRMVYVSQGRLFTRRLDQPNTTELAGTQGAYEPFFSPDGQWVAFFTTGKLQKISVEGGSAITLCNATNPRGGSWGEDGNIIASLSAAGGLSRIPSAGGPPTPVSELQSGDGTHRWPQILPGGKAVLFTASPSTAFDAANIEVMSLADHRRKTLVRGGTFGRYLPSGHLVYVNRGTLFAVRFDVDRLEVHGTPAPVLDQVNYNAVQGSAQLDFSQTGTLIYRSGGAGGALLTIAWLDDAGKTQPLLAKPGTYGRPGMSPDGQRLALEVTEGSGTDIWLYDWKRDTMTRLTFTGNANAPLWSPDGRYIAFTTLGEGMSVIRSDGSGKPQPLTQSKNIQFPWSFTPEGKRLAFYEQDSKTARDLWTVPLESDSAGLRAGKPEVFLQTLADERYPSFSPDGRWMVYVSDESGILQVYVRAFPDKGGKWQISNSGGTYPMWSRTGHELFFETSDNHIMAATYTEKGDSFIADKPRLWSEKQIGGTIGNKNVDLAPDGKRIVALMPVETAEAQKAQNQVTFLENFSDELRRKVPIGK
jgi:Tol biopolymer transport system component/tRNA A-37 threonylcarbamoyl transferase component Bud32